MSSPERSRPLPALLDELRGRRVYVASPYWHADPDVRAERVNTAALTTLSLINAGVFAYSPVVHSKLLVDVAIAHDEEPSEAVWRAHGLGMIASFSVLLVLEMDGTSLSTGVSAEVETARKRSIPVVYAPATDRVVDLGAEFADG